MSILLGSLLAGGSILQAGAASKANAQAAIASANSMKMKAQATELSAEAAKRQAKAENVIRQETYNDMAATQMVMGVASGRSVSEGSMRGIMDSDFENFQWDQLWNTHNSVINQAAIYGDVAQLQQGALQTIKGAEASGNAQMFGSLLSAGKMFMPRGG